MKINGKNFAAGAAIYKIAHRQKSPS